MSTSISRTDVPQDAASAKSEEPAPQDGWRSGGLPALRAELDRIDDTIHDLLMERAGVVEYVARSGKPAAFRPGREASMLRRLLGRHSGALPPVTLVRMWREMLAGTTAMQGGFSLAVGDAAPNTPLGQLAREHFGALTPLRLYGSAGQAMADTSQGHAAAAVLPFPSDHETWWISLLHHEPRLYVNGLLPFWRPRPEGLSDVRALVVAPTPPDPSGQDRSYLGLECDSDVSRTRLSSELAGAGLKPEMMVLVRPNGSSVAYVLVEVDGYLMDDDARLSNLGSVLRRPVVLGSYAEPVGGA
ncbi:MAG TPA: chorismate mutase [Rhodopila sp.]|uniref:chorismate mutase n=1 Tax=Rhodopila sp. TaxID=2480087 RepID=UPI002BD7071F|nr:chorismate mutase [Rhodopila sp.]HVY16661.1 chorismate mutase [Rhodopila sp.]